MSFRVAAATLAALAAAALAVAAPAAAVTFRTVASGLTAPVYLTGRANALIVVQQGGDIVAIDRTTKVKRPFFTVPNIETGGEKGLLGLAFDPSYSRNGRFYVDVTARVGSQLVTEIRRYTNAAIATEAPLLITRIDQPFDNHNGGWIDFGPTRSCMSRWATAGRATIR